MKDQVIKGTGNSRYLKSVSNFKALYPNYDAFVTALINGTLPIDLAGINPNGITQTGTPLTKQTFLTAATAKLLGLISGSQSDANVTVDQALSQLRRLDLLAIGPISVTIPVSAWYRGSSSSPYVQTVSVPQIVAGDTHLDIMLAHTDDGNSATLQRRAFNHISEAWATSGGIKFICRQARPDVSISCVVKGVRKYGTT